MYEKLNKSKFRSSFKLKDKDLKYIEKQGYEKIRQHAYDFISKRLAPEYIENDGKQTPMRGHPVFIAQHACGFCCRGCLERIHGIPKNRELTEKEVEYITKFIIIWIKNEEKSCDIGFSIIRSPSTRDFEKFIDTLENEKADLEEEER